MRAKLLSALVVAAATAAASVASAQSIEEKAQACAACHGENGAPPQQASPAPVIWGQKLGYLFVELRDFKSGARKNDTMSPVVEALDVSDLLPLAEYFAKKTWPSLQQKQPPPDVAAEAQRLNGAFVCTSCHQEGFKGEGTQPRLAGQVAAYLQKTMTDFRTGARANNPGMTGFTKGISDQDIAALAAWLAGM
jgi:cytochrome c553